MSKTFSQFAAAVQKNEPAYLEFTAKDGRACDTSYADAKYRVWKPTVINLAGPCQIYSLISKVDVDIPGFDVHASVKMDFDSETGSIKGIFVTGSEGDGQQQGISASSFIDSTNAADFAEKNPKAAAGLAMAQVTAKLVDVILTDSTGALTMFPHIIANRVVGSYLARVYALYSEKPLPIKGE
ncbi:TPA: hypothetical protein PMB18_003938 [Vibrio cholerae]|nr:hypothetical protein [Vibrio cholerae]HDI3138895.1 hypothetical protein [Vibrio cholerae]